MLSTSTVLGLRGQHNYEDAFQQHTKKVILRGGLLMLAVQHRHQFYSHLVLLTDIIDTGYFGLTMDRNVVIRHVTIKPCIATYRGSRISKSAFFFPVCSISLL